MCGGIGFKIDSINKDELRVFYTPDDVKKFEKSGIATSFFWQANPVLPSEENNTINLYQWGDRSGLYHLPKTGWAKLESIEAGTWARFNPQFITIPAIRGFEKGVWFDIEHGIRGLLIGKDHPCAYMITKPADPAYIALTHHPRQPVIIEE